MERHETIEFVGKMRTPFRLADRECLFLAIVGRRQMVDSGEQRTELLAVVHDPANRNAAETDAMISALAPDQPHARRIAPHIVIGERDLERGIDRFRPGIAEEHVIEVARRKRCNAARQLESLGMAKLKGRRIIERRGFALNRGNDRLAIVAGIGAPQARRPVDQLASVTRDIVHVLGADDQSRTLLEGPVGRERHPIGLKVVGDRSRYGCALNLSHDRSQLSCPPSAGHPRLIRVYHIKAWMAATSPAMTNTARLYTLVCKPPMTDKPNK